MRLLLLTLVLITSFTGCRKRRPADPGAGPVEAAPSAEGASKSAGAAGPSTTTPANRNLPEEPKPDHQIMLTRALFTFQGKNGRPPKDWDELVSSGVLPKMPQAPTGKRYVFDRSLNVRMVPAQ